MLLHVQCQTGQSVPSPALTWEFSLLKSYLMPDDCKNGRNSAHSLEVTHFPNQNGSGQWGSVLSFKQQFYVTDRKQNGESRISCRILLNFEHD